MGRMNLLRRVERLEATLGAPSPEPEPQPLREDPEHLGAVLAVLEECLGEEGVRALLEQRGRELGHVPEETEEPTPVAPPGPDGQETPRRQERRERTQGAPRKNRAAA